MVVIEDGLRVEGSGVNVLDDGIPLLLNGHKQGHDARDGQKQHQYPSEHHVESSVVISHHARRLLFCTPLPERPTVSRDFGLSSGMSTIELLAVDRILTEHTDEIISGDNENGWMER